MAKHPVPKKKTSKTRSGNRYGNYKRKQLTKLDGLVAGSRHRFKKSEAILKEDKQKKEVEKITKVKA
jgi:ribosomal protein L32